ncbi:MAG: helix-turn-helix domain-containing protein [Candidatus Aenigmarchaeota archaeon]|nr:helix-turn-helix domain-containing protein [Candidatus Aenigmarchaeota archaeon]
MEKMFCEKFVPKILPAVRAIMASILINEFNLTQTETAKKLGITQPAVSQYLKGLRARHVRKIMKNEKIMGKIEEITTELVNKKNFKMEKRFCEICELIREEKIF